LLGFETLATRISLDVENNRFGYAEKTKKILFRHIKNYTRMTTLISLLPLLSPLQPKYPPHRCKSLCFTYENWDHKEVLGFPSKQQFFMKIGPDDGGSKLL
jgi:hypothetical protein